LGKVLIAYYSTSEKGKPSNEDKVVQALQKFIKEVNMPHKILLLEPKNKLPLKEQFKQEKNLELKEKVASLKGINYLIIGSPIVGTLTSAPLVNAFIRSLPKHGTEINTKFYLFSTGILPGFALKKMQSLLSMKGIKSVESAAFTSMFEFDSKKIDEVKKFFNKIQESTPA
jgi:hypothetical protein